MRSPDSAKRLAGASAFLAGALLVASNAASWATITRAWAASVETAVAFPGLPLVAAALALLGGVAVFQARWRWPAVLSFTAALTVMTVVLARTRFRVGGLFRQAATSGLDPGASNAHGPGMIAALVGVLLLLIAWTMTAIGWPSSVRLFSSLRGALGPAMVLSVAVGAGIFVAAHLGQVMPGDRLPDLISHSFGT